MLKSCQTACIMFKAILCLTLLSENTPRGKLRLEQK